MSMPIKYGEHSRRRGVALGLSMVLCAFAVPVVYGQAKPVTEAAKPSPVPSSEDRKKAMQADMERLLQLARQLKSEVDSSRKDELSMKVVRDADEIDKLARSARGRLQGGR